MTTEPVIPTAEPSMADLRAMRDATAEPAEVKQEPAEPAKAEPATEAAQEPAEKKQEPTEDEPLPEGVQKRIAKEAEKAARIQSEIDRAVSARKAKEKELADLTASGSQPAPTSAAAKKAPEFGEKGHEEETYGQFQQRDREYLRAEILAETRKTVEQEFTAKQQKEMAKAKWDAAIEREKAAGTIKDAQEFADLMAKAESISTPEMQTVISSLDNWAGVALHLAKNPEKMAEVSLVFRTDYVKGIARLARIEASLKSATKPAAEAVLPNPPAKEGGGASASVGAFDIEKASMSQLRRHAVKLGLRKAG